MDLSAQVEVSHEPTKAECDAEYSWFKKSLEDVHELALGALEKHLPKFIEYFEGGKTALQEACG